MNDWSSKNAYVDKSKSGTQSCPKCGCTVDVTVLLQDEHNEMEEYFCPNNSCDNKFSVRACCTLEVSLVKLK